MVFLASWAFNTESVSRECVLSTVCHGYETKVYLIIHLEPSLSRFLTFVPVRVTGFLGEPL